MSLDAKIPPPAVAAVAAVVMWGIARLAPQVSIPPGIRLVGAVVLLVIGLAVGIAGVLSFRRARTTLDPLQPGKASALVSSGIYRFTRNPMYLGLLLVLVAWAVFQFSAWALLGVAGFVLYVGRFQITPEERALAGLFGGEYASYARRVRRWL